MVDIGAMANVLNEKIFNSLNATNQISSNSKPVTRYGNLDQALSVMGFNLTIVKWKGKKLRAPLIVMTRDKKAD